MARKKKNRKASAAKQKRLAKKNKWKQENESRKNFERMGPAYKEVLRMRGCNLPFYDYLDSYTQVFHKFANEAVKNQPSLLGVHELDEDANTVELDWSSLGYKNLEQIFFDIDGELDDYGKGSADANLSGSMTAFRNENGELKSIITIQKSVKGSMQLAEYKYALKVAALVHEIGHVVDLESGKNIDAVDKTMDVFEAEAFAHLYALERLAKSGLRQSFMMLYDALAEAVGGAGYIAKVAGLVMERVPKYKLVDWNDFLEDSLTADEYKKLTPASRRIFDSRT